MSETNASPASSDNSATPGNISSPAAAGADAGAAASATPAIAPAAPAAPSAKGKGAAVRAAERAEARRSGAASALNSSTATAVAPAASSGSPPVAGAPAADGAQPNGGMATAGAEAGSENPTGSTVMAPDDWSEEGKARFAALPDDNARAMVLDTYKDMHRQFTDQMTTLAQLRSGHEELHRTIDQHGIDPEEANRILSMSTVFAKQPRQVLQQLAAQAGIEVFFERPLPAGEIPEFKTSAEMVEYTRQQVLDAVRKEREVAEEESRKAADLDREKTEIRNQVSAARAKFGEGFTNQQPAVFERMLAPLSVEDAYSLLTLPALRQQAEAGARAQQELQALKAKAESDRMRATVPPAGMNGAAKAEDLSLLPAAERAIRRAEARVRAAQA